MKYMNSVLILKKKLPILIIFLFFLILTLNILPIYSAVTSFTTTAEHDGHLNDEDQDGLSYAEEIYLGSDFVNPNSHVGINDNAYWTQYFKNIIDALPTTLQTNIPYKIEFQMNGIENCLKCGAQVNMGFVKIINHKRIIEPHDFDNIFRCQANIINKLIS